MHHQPAPVGTPMIDECMLQNPDPFWEIISGYPVKMIMCGHVHGDYSVKYNDEITIEASPATCIQWLKGSIQPKFVNKIGYKTYYFDKDSYISRAKIWKTSDEHIQVS
jgi:Icc protein